MDSWPSSSACFWLPSVLSRRCVGQMPPFCREKTHQVCRGMKLSVSRRSTRSVADEGLCNPTDNRTSTHDNHIHALFPSLPHPFRRCYAASFRSVWNLPYSLWPNALNSLTFITTLSISIPWSVTMLRIPGTVSGPFLLVQPLLAPGRITEATLMIWCTNIIRTNRLARSLLDALIASYPLLHSLHAALVCPARDLREQVCSFYCFTIVIPASNLYLSKCLSKTRLRPAHFQSCL